MAAQGHGGVRWRLPARCLCACHSGRHTRQCRTSGFARREGARYYEILGSYIRSTEVLGINQDSQVCKAYY